LAGSGAIQFSLKFQFMLNFRHPLFSLALVVAGLAILFARSWGYLAKKRGQNYFFDLVEALVSVSLSIL